MASMSTPNTISQLGRGISARTARRDCYGSDSCGDEAASLRFRALLQMEKVSGGGGEETWHRGLHGVAVQDQYLEERRSDELSKGKQVSSTIGMYLRHEFD